MGWGIEEYIVLKPAFKGILGVAGVAAGGAEEPLLAPLAPPTTASTEVRLWLRNFSSRRHLARLLLNHT